MKYQKVEIAKSMLEMLIPRCLRRGALFWVLINITIPVIEPFPLKHLDST